MAPLVLVAEALAARGPPTVAEAAAGQELPMGDVRLRILSLGAISRAVAVETPAAVKALLGAQVLETGLLELVRQQLVLVAVAVAAHFLVEALWRLLVVAEVVVDEAGPVIVEAQGMPDQTQTLARNHVFRLLREVHTQFALQAPAVKLLFLGIRNE